MDYSLYENLLVSALIALVIIFCYLVKKISKWSDGRMVAVTIGSIVLSVFIYKSIDCKASIVYEINSKNDYSKKVCFDDNVIYRDSDNTAKYFDIKPQNIYIINNTNEDGVLYSVAYSQKGHEDDISSSSLESRLISSHRVTQIDHDIDCFFVEPDKIESSSTTESELLYIFDWLTHYVDTH